MAPHKLFSASHAISRHILRPETLDSQQHAVMLPLIAALEAVFTSSGASESLAGQLVES